MGFSMQIFETTISDYEIVVFGVRLSRETMKLCTMPQFLVELQRLLWLHMTMLDRQALLSPVVTGERHTWL